MPCSETGYILWKRNYVASKLLKASFLNSDEIHLHVVQGNQHGLNNSRMLKQLSQIINRKPEARIHVIVGGSPSYYNRRSGVTTLISQLFIHVTLATRTHATIRSCNQICLNQRRCVLPAVYFYAAGGKAVRATFQKFHLASDRRRRLVRRMESRETLHAHSTMEKHHARQDRMHCLNSPEGRLAK